MERLVAAGDETLHRLRSIALSGRILGPVDCAVERVQNRWRRHLLIKLQAGASSAPIGEALLGFAPKNVQVVVDVDPYSLM
jgi:primosomal protein N'